MAGLSASARKEISYAAYDGPDLELLYAGQHAESDVDIIAIHGLGANPVTTWVSEFKDGGAMRSVHWLKDKDMLPAITPNARIWAFRYNSKWLGEAPIQRLGTLADHLLLSIHRKRHSEADKRRPIVFIAHSFGGILLEAALTAKTIESQHAHILDATTGIVFLGTPFRGSASAQFAILIADAATALGYESQKKLLEVLLPDSDVLADLLHKFATTAGAHGLSIVCFFEQLPTEILRTRGLGWLASRTKRIIVPRQQASLDMFPSIGLGLSHTTMNKFSSPNDKFYQLLASQISELAEWKPKTRQSKPVQSAANEMFNVPYYENPNFVDRADIMAQLKRHLDQGIERSAALHGLGGVGKSQLAIAYAYATRATLPDVSVFWVHAASRARFEQSYREIAKVVGLSVQTKQANETLQIVRGWFDSRDGPRWLLIIDNADDECLFSAENGDDLSKYIPKSSRGSVLYTSRDRNACLRLVGARSIIKVNSMETDDCRKLLSKAMTDEIYGSGDTLRLIDVMQNLPLALAQAAAYMEQNSLSIAKYLELFDSDEFSKIDLLDSDFRASGRDSDIPNALTRTWRLSFDQIQKKQPLAAHILSVMGLLDKHDIPRELLPGGKSKVDFETAIGTLQAFSMITADSTTNGYNMHRLMQLSILKWLHDSGGIKALSDLGIRILADQWPDYDVDKWQTCARYLPHVESMLRHAQGSKAYPKRHVDVLARSGEYLRTQGDYAKSRVLLEQAVELATAELGPDARFTMMSKGILASTFMGMGYWKKAEEIDSELLETKTKMLGPEDRSTLGTMLKLASSLWHQKEYERAEELQLKMVEISKRVLGMEHLHTLTGMANLATTYRTLGRWKEAEVLDIQVMKAKERILGRDHPHTLTAMANLAASYKFQGRLEEAEKIEILVLDMKTKILGQDHPQTLTSMENMADTWHRQGKKEDALALWLQSTTLSEKKLGPEHPETMRRQVVAKLWLSGTD